MTTGTEMQDDPMKYLKLDDAQRLKEQAKVFDPKKWCWVATAKDDEDGYTEGEIMENKGEIWSVQAKGVTKDYKKDECDPMNPPKYEKCSDMANLTYLNEASVLYNLKARYQAGLIYTYSGLFCVAINPYRRLPIYLDEVVTMYRGKRRPEMPPHIFAIVDNAYQDMLIDHENQSMLITGESGAGKTENTKKVIQYIAKVAGVEKKDAPKEEPSGGVAKIKGTLDEQVVQANPLLEAFGNAKTTRNNNSSRFGKFIRCHFSQTGKLAGADIESYLLEKNRVIHQGSLERNYHIFYQILYASTDEELAGYCLLSREAKDYGFLSKGVAHVDRMDDHEEFALTVDAIKVLGFTPDEHKSMFKITAAVLNFSTMKFKQKPREEQAEVVDPSDGERVSYLLGLPVGEFHKSLTKPKVKVGTEYVNKGQNVDQVLYSIAALSKALFERLFWWIVERVNKALDTKQKRSYFIGVLDIAGFEIFDYNSFEQLCINLTNEKLQQFFNHHMFVLEQEEYKKEGIHWEFIDFGMDLEETINLVEKPMGIFAMLEEECIVPKATDQTYLNKLHKEHAGKSKSYTKPTPKQTKSGLGDFILHHYAGSVGYSVAGWLEKNKDPINENTAQLFSKATDPLISHLFNDYDPDKAGKRKGSAFQTVSFRHKEQLKNLLGTLMATAPHFVRCIIPNEKKAPGEIEGQLILHQLRCNGVLEGIRICRKGFPSRMLFTDFKQRYQILAASAIPEGFVDGKVAVEKLIEALQLDESEYRIGLTKVFFRSGIVGELEEMRDERLSKIISQFQAYCKAHLMRIEYGKMKERRLALAVIQRNIRKFFAVRNWPWWKLYIKVQPLLSIARAEDEMKEKEEALKEAMENAVANEAKRKELEETLTTAMSQKEKMAEDLKYQSDMLVETEEKLAGITTEKEELEKTLNEMMEKLEGEEHSAKLAKERTKKFETEIDELNNKADEASANISRLEGEKSSALKQIDSLNEDIKGHEEAYSKLGKEKKAVEDTLQERSDQLQASEEKLNATNKAKNKVEATLKETEFSLQKEKDAKAKVEKEKKKVEAELKETKDTLLETEDNLKTAKDTIIKRDKAIRELEDVKEGLENTIKQLQKKIAELLAKIEELEEELENERKARQKVEMAKKELEAQLEEIQEALVNAGDATTAQVDVVKKKESEIARLKTELEEANAAADEALASAKSKAAAALAEVTDELDGVKKAKAKSDKDKAAVAAELEEITAALESTKKQVAAGVKNARGLDEQANGLRAKVDELETALADEKAKSAKAAADASTNGKLLDEAEGKLAQAKKEKMNLDSTLNELKQQVEDEAKGKADASNKLKEANAELESVNEALEEETAAKNALQAKLSKAISDAKSAPGFDPEAQAKVVELEDLKRKLTATVADLEESLSAAESKAASLEKAKARMSEEAEDLQLDLEKAKSTASSLEKKQKKVDATVAEWKSKVDDLVAQLEAAQKESRTASAEVVKLRAANVELEENYDAKAKENRALAAENKTIAEQLSGGGKSNLEVDKLTRKLEAENEELTLALEEAEAALEQEEAKTLKLTLDGAQSKAATDKKLAEIAEEVEASRKNHARQLDALQTTVEHELKNKENLLKDRRIHETRILELEGQLDAAGRSSGDNVKTVKKLQAQIKELQAMVDDEARGRDDARDAAAKSEKRANELAVVADEQRVALEAAERAKRAVENEKGEVVERVSELQALFDIAANAKRKVEGDYHNLEASMEELEVESKALEGKANRAASEVGRLTAELANALDAVAMGDKSRAVLANQVTDLQAQLEEAENQSGRGLKVNLRKLEQRIAELESDAESDARRSAEIVKASKKADAKVKEVELSLEEANAKALNASSNAEKMNTAMKHMRLQLEQAEANNALLQSKYKKAAAELAEADERCEAAEAALLKARQRAREGQSLAATRGASGAPSRTRSRVRTPAAED